MASGNTAVASVSVFNPGQPSRIHTVPEGRRGVTLARAANRLAVTLDLKRPSEAAERVIAHLRAIDVADRRKGLILSILGSMAFSVLVVLALLVIVLVWRGFV